MKFFLSRTTLLYLLLSLAATLNAQDTLYWVGGAGNWDDPAHWSLTSGGAGGAGIPDSLIFTVMDQNSFSADGQTITLPLAHNQVGGMWWRNLNYDVEMYFPFDYVNFFFASIETYGDVNLHQKLTPVYGNGNCFWEVKGNDTIDFATGLVDLSNLYITLDTGGVLNLQKQVNVSGYFRMTSAGTFNSNDFDMQCDQVSFIPRDNDTVFGNFGQSNITARVSWDAEFYNAGNGKVLILDMDSTVLETQEFTPGRNIDYGIVNIACTSLSWLIKCGVVDDFVSAYRNETSTIGFLRLVTGTAFEIFGHNTIRNSLVIENPGVSIELNEGDTLTIQGDILQPYLSAGGCAPNIVFKSDRTGEAYFIKKNSGTLDVQLATLKDANTKGGATFNAEDCVDLGNNTGWTFTTTTGPQTFYWIDGSGDFNDTTHWSTTSGGVVSGCVPGGMDKVIFDENSFTSLGDTVTIPPGVFDIDTMIWRNQTMYPLLQFTGTDIDNSVMRIFGSLKLHTNIRTAYASTSDSWEFVNPDTCLIDTKNKNMSRVVFDSDSAYFKLLSNLKADFISHKSGYFDCNNMQVTTGTYNMGSGCSSSDCEAKALRLRNSLFIATHFDTRFNYGSQTILAGTSTIVTSDFQAGVENDQYYNLVLDSAESILVDARNHTFNSVKITGGKEVAFKGDFTINDQLVIETTGSTISFEQGKLYTITNGITQNTGANPCGEFTFFTSSEPGVTASLSVPNNGFTLDMVAIQDVDISGGFTYQVTNGLNLGNSSGWTITNKTPQDFYYLGTSDQYWTTPANWSLSSGGSPGTCIPTVNDNVIFDLNSFSGTYASVHIKENETVFCADMSWNNAPAGSELSFDGYSGNLCYLKTSGSLVFQSNLTLANSDAYDYIYLIGGDSNTITTNGLSMPTLYLKGGGVYQLTDNYNGASFRIHNGTFDTQNFDMTLSGFFSTRSEGYKKIRLRGSTINCGLGMDNGYLNSTFSMDFLSHTSSIITPGLTSKNGLSYYNVWINSDYPDTENYDGCSFNILRFSGIGSMDIIGSFHIDNKLIIDQPGFTFRMHDFDTLYLAGTIETGGTPANPVHIHSLEYFADNAMTIVKNNGHLCLENLAFKDVENSGAGQLNALNCVDEGANSSINFITSTGSGNSLYWIGQSGQWRDTQAWSYSSGGCPAGRYPTASDTVWIDDNSFLQPNLELNLAFDEEVYSIWSSNSTFGIIKMADTLLARELRLNGGNLMLKDGHFKTKTGVILSGISSLSLDTATLSFVNNPSLTSVTGFTLGNNCNLSLNFSEFRACGQSAVGGTKSVALNPGATVTWTNSDFTIKPPATGEPNNDILIDFGGHTINGLFILSNTAAPAQNILLESNMIVNGELQVKQGVFKIQPGFNLLVQ